MEIRVRPDPNATGEQKLWLATVEGQPELVASGPTPQDAVAELSVLIEHQRPPDDNVLRYETPPQLVPKPAIPYAGRGLVTREIEQPDGGQLALYRFVSAIVWLTIFAIFAIAGGIVLRGMP